jgi:hypothetical protein
MAQTPVEPKTFSEKAEQIEKQLSVLFPQVMNIKCL